MEFRGREMGKGGKKVKGGTLIVNFGNGKGNRRGDK